MDIVILITEYLEPEELPLFELNKEFKNKLNMKWKSFLDKKYEKEYDFKVKWMKHKIKKKMTSYEIQIKKLDELRNTDRMRLLFGIREINKKKINNLKKLEDEYVKLKEFLKTL